MATVTEDKQKEKRERIMAAAKGSSGEPSVTEENYSIELPHALNYYSAFEDYKTRRAWVVKYTKKHGMEKEFAIASSEAKDYHFAQVGAIMRLKDRGQFVSEKHWNDILAKFDKIKVLADQKRIEDEDFEEKKNVKVVVDKTNILVDQCMDKINGEIDHYISNKKVNRFDLKSFLSINNVNSTAKKIISEILQGTSKELSMVNFDDSEDQLTEGYSNFTRREFKGYKDFIDSMIDSCSVSKKPRKAKIIKQKPISVISEKIKYMSEARVGSVTLKSLKPESIVGAKELWLYNANNKILWSYKSNVGLSVNGSFILGYEEALSCGKKIRNPEKFLSGNMAKIPLNESFKEIQTNSFPINNRTNDSLIILKVFT